MYEKGVQLQPMPFPFDAMGHNIGSAVGILQAQNENNVPCGIMYEKNNMFVEMPMENINTCHSSMLLQQQQQLLSMSSQNITNTNTNIIARRNTLNPSIFTQNLRNPIASNVKSLETITQHNI